VSGSTHGPSQKSSLFLSSLRFFSFSTVLHCVKSGGCQAFTDDTVLDSTTARRRRRHVVALVAIVIVVTAAVVVVVFVVVVAALPSPRAVALASLWFLPLLSSVFAVVAAVIKLHELSHNLHAVLNLGPNRLWLKAYDHNASVALYIFMFLYSIAVVVVVFVVVVVNRLTSFVLVVVVVVFVVVVNS